MELTLNRLVAVICHVPVPALRTYLLQVRDTCLFFHVLVRMVVGLITLEPRLVSFWFVFLCI